MIHGCPECAPSSPCRRHADDDKADEIARLTAAEAEARETIARLTDANDRLTVAYTNCRAFATAEAAATIARLEQERDEARAELEAAEQHVKIVNAARDEWGASRASLHAALRELPRYDLCHEQEGEDCTSTITPHPDGTLIKADDLAALLPSPQEQT